MVDRLFAGNTDYMCLSDPHERATGLTGYNPIVNREFTRRICADVADHPVFEIALFVIHLCMGFGSV